MRTRADFTTLPTALLPQAKAHSRIEHDRDDALVTSYVAQAISHIERACDINIFDADFDFNAEALDRPGCTCAVGTLRAVELPVNNVREFAVLDSGGVDQSAEFVLRQATFGGGSPAFLIGYLVGSPAWLGSLAVTVGMLTPAELEPALLGAILRLAAARYENREASLELYAEPFTAELRSLWRPAA